MTFDERLAKIEFDKICNNLPIRKRKNLGALTRAFQNAYDDPSSSLKPGTVIDTANIIEALGEDVEKWFDRARYRGDEHGPTRAVGDLVGGHGMGLRRIETRRYILPKKLPIVRGDKLYQEAEY